MVKVVAKSNARLMIDHVAGNAVTHTQKGPSSHNITNQMWPTNLNGWGGPKIVYSDTARESRFGRDVVVLLICM